VIIINPPWKLEGELSVILPALAERLSQGGPSFGVTASG